MQFIAISLMVLFIATVFSIVGLGGALIYVPLFFWLGIDLSVAIPTALLLNFITSGSASVTYYKQKLIMGRFATPLIMTSVIFAPLGAYASQFMADDMILAMFAVILILASIRMFLPLESRVQTPAFNANLVGVAGGIIIGFAAGLLGLGGGVFAVPLMLLLGFEPKNASATSALFVTFTSLSGLLGHISVGTIDTQIMLFTGLAAFTGAQIGSRLMVRHLQSRTVLRVFGVILLLIAAKIIYQLT